MCLANNGGFIVFGNYTNINGNEILYTPITGMDVFYEVPLIAISVFFL